MITNIRQLRLSVLDLFSTLADNGPDPQRNQSHKESVLDSRTKLYHHQTIANIISSHSLCSSSASMSRVQRQLEFEQQNDLIQYVNQAISNIANIVRMLDQEIITLSQNSQIITPGESVHLAMESSIDKHNLYTDLCKSYKTFTKLQEYSKDCHRLLLQQSLKRVHKKSDATIGVGSGSAPSSQQQQSLINRQQTSAASGGFARPGVRSESIVATFNPYLHETRLARNSIDKMLENYVKNSKSSMESHYSQPFGSSTGVFQIGVNKVLKAILMMRGVVIDAVIVKAYHESFAAGKSQHNNHARVPNVNNSGRFMAQQSDHLVSGSIGPGASPFVDQDDEIDLWSESKYAVFRKLTHHANAAVLHFQYPTCPEMATQTFLVSI